MIVMPVANEEATMGTVLDQILALPYNELYIYVVMDSYSTDRTRQIVEEYEEKTDRVKLVYYEKSYGVISCYLEGFRHALRDGAERIIEMDGGGSHLPEEIPQFMEKLEQGYDCVFGSRFVEGGGISNHPLYRRFLSSGGTILSNFMLGTKYKDMTSGFEGFQRQILEQMDLDRFLSKGHMYQTEMRYYCRKFRYIEVPIHYVGSESSLKLKSVIEAIKILFLLRRNEKRVMKNS